MTKIRTILSALIIVLYLNACAYLHIQKHLDAKITTSSQLNPDLNQRASPIVVTFYQLQNKLPFKTLSYEQLSYNPYLHLKTSLIDFTRLEMQPAQQRKLEIKLNPKTAYIGVIAAYRELDKSSWRKIIELPRNLYRHKLKINLAKQQLNTQLD